MTPLPLSCCRKAALTMYRVWVLWKMEEDREDVFSDEHAVLFWKTNFSKFRSELIPHPFGATFITNDNRDFSWLARQTYC